MGDRKFRAVRVGWAPWWALAWIILLGCGGPTTLRARMDEAEGKGRQAESFLDEADHEIRALEVERAEKLLAKAKDLLADPEIAKYPEHGLLKERVTESEVALALAKKEIEKRELERAVLAHRQILEGAEGRLGKAIDLVKSPDVDASRIEEARDAISDLEDRLEDGSELETKDKGLADHAGSVRKNVESAKAEARRAEIVLAFREGPLAARREALSLVESAKKEKDRERQREIYADALARLRACADKGKEMLATSPDLAKASIVLDAKRTAPGVVSTACAKDVVALEKKMKELAKRSAQEKAKAEAKERAKERAKEAALSGKSGKGRGKKRR